MIELIIKYVETVIQNVVLYVKTGNLILRAMGTTSVCHNELIAEEFHLNSISQNRGNSLSPCDRDSCPSESDVIT